MRINLISVVIPAYNEENSIGQVLSELYRLTEIFPTPFEFLVIDDASTDRTGEIVAKYDSVKYLRHPINGGKGVALRTGFKVAKGDIVVIQDADMEYHPYDIPSLLHPIINGEADVVFGSRFLGKSEGMSFSHRLGNKMLSITASLLYDVAVTDVMTGYKLFTREVLDSFDLSENGFGVEIEILSKCLARGWRIIEVPISYAYRKYGSAKISYRDGVKSMWSLITNRYKF